ncbi:MAG: energy-coupling factor ABC transporter ATP-binding protein [Promethearchaeota archaeon]
MEISDLSVKYQGSPNWALRGINFSIKKEELIIIAGSSGCGKSTLAQTILGLIPAFIKAGIQGKIVIKEKVVNELTREEIVQLIGYVPQYPADFITSLLVEEEIAFPLENLAFPRLEIQSRISDIFDQLEISNLQNRLMTELSSGELQRVALATALAPQPPILVLDEPMARIDPKSEIKLAHILHRLSHEGHLVLAFEHRLDYLLPLADRMIILENGKVVADGKPRSVIDDIKHVDLPEVLEVNWQGIVQRPLSITEAKKHLIKVFSDM